MDVLKVRVENGKYELVRRTSLSGHGIIVEVRRDGQAWSFVPNCAPVLAMMAELDAARVVLEAARKLGDAAPSEIREALARHARLVSDDELPSVWTLPSAVR